MNRENWKTVKLGDIAELQFGYAYKSDKFISDEIPVIRIGDITETGLTPDYSCCYPLTFWNEHPELRLKKDSILIAMSGATVGKSCINDKDEKLLLNQRVASIVSTNKSFTKYLFHSIKSNSFKTYVEKASIGCAQPNISGKQISDFEIPLPPLDVQKQIALNLDQVTKVIAEHKELLAKYDLLIKSRFIEMFGDPVTNPMGWETGNMTDITNKITDGEHGTVPRCENNGFLYLMARNVTQQNSLDLTEISYIPEENHKKMYKRCNPETGDLLLVCVGATVGKSCLVPEMEPFSMARSLALLKPNYSKINSVFLLNLVSSFYIQNQIQNCVHAAAQAGLYTNMISNLKVFIPPLELQQQFADFVQQIDKSKLVVQQSLEKAETLYKSLMQEYFG